MDDLSIWRAEQYEWKRKGIKRKPGCPRYYTGCQCNECLERDKEAMYLQLIRTLDSRDLQEILEIIAQEENPNENTEVK
jgi:hypothetical protein